jgi:hypothetical protein
MFSADFVFMPVASQVSVKDLKLDLRNFRMVPQKNERNSVHAMITINPDWFWALMDSLASDGYLPTENIIVLRKPSGELIVKEGNRRVGALKMIFGLLKRDGLDVPADLESKVQALPKAWLDANEKIPCAIYDAKQEEFVDRIVSLTHGKGEKAGRDKWNAIARARHHRDKDGASEPALDLLEKYLTQGKNLSRDEAERWSGDYPLTIAEEAIKRIATRFGVGSSRELADRYPDKISKRATLETILKDVGQGTLDFETIRDKQADFAERRYGLPPPPPQPPPGAGPQGGTGAKPPPPRPRPAALSIDDPRSVTRALKLFGPRGNKREKLVTLLIEARTLKLEKHPHAFCFLLRSMFEISAKAYCDDHGSAGGPSTVNAKGEDRRLVDVLRDVVNHLTKNQTDRAITKSLHGAITELAKSEGLLSVTSLNQLVHNPRFSINPSDISRLFHNVFPLLEPMNS